MLKAIERLEELFSEKQSKVVIALMFAARLFSFLWVFNTRLLTIPHYSPSFSAVNNKQRPILELCYEVLMNKNNSKVWKYTINNYLTSLYHALRSTHFRTYVAWAALCTTRWFRVECYSKWRFWKEHQKPSSLDAVIKVSSIIESITGVLKEYFDFNSSHNHFGINCCIH